VLLVRPGLIEMEERARLIGGTLIMECARGGWGVPPVKQMPPPTGQHWCWEREGSDLLALRRVACRQQVNVRHA
jgi:hypothetical protein